MDNNEQQQSKKKRVRRCTKQDETPRAYKCGCGRGYYSYPALYTHLKIKHSGSPPMGTEIPENKHYGSRGRPRERTIAEPEQHQVFIDEDRREERKQTEQLINKQE